MLIASTSMREHGFRIVGLAATTLCRGLRAREAGYLKSAIVRAFYVFKNDNSISTGCERHDTSLTSMKKILCMFLSMDEVPISSPTARSSATPIKHVRVSPLSSSF